MPETKEVLNQPKINQNVKAAIDQEKAAVNEGKAYLPVTIETIPYTVTFWAGPREATFYFVEGWVETKRRDTEMLDRQLHVSIMREAGKNLSYSRISRLAQKSEFLQKLKENIRKAKGEII